MGDEPPAADLQSTKRSSADSNEEPCVKKKIENSTSEITDECEQRHDNVHSFSIYKLHHSFLKTDEDHSKVDKSVFNNETLAVKIEDLLLEEFYKIKHQSEYRRKKIGDWNVSWFVYKIENDRNEKSERIAADLTQYQTYLELDESDSEGELLKGTRRQNSGHRNTTQNECPQIAGHRNTTNMVVFYQILNEQPLVFFLLDGKQPFKLLYYADPDFPIEVANQLMDSTKIHKLETINIAGASLKTSKTFLESKSKSVPFDGPTWSMLNEIVIYATSSIDKSNPDTSFFVKSEEKENVSLTVGQYFVRVEKELTMDQHSKFLSLLVRRNENVKRKPFYNFGYVHRLGKYDKRQISENMKALKKRTMEFFLDKNPPNNNLAIYHRCIMDWVSTNKVILYNEQVKDKKMKKIKEWLFCPGLPEIHDALQTEYGDNLKAVFESDNFKLSFKMQKKSECDDLFNYIHGNIVNSKGVTHHRIAYKWYRVTGEYSDIIDKSFVELMDNCYLNSEKDQSRYPKLPLPWKKKKTCTFSQKELGDYFHLGEDDAQKLLKILTEPTWFVKQTDLMCDLRELGCSFPTNSGIFKEIEWKKDIKIRGKTHDSKPGFLRAIELSLYEDALSDSPCEWILQSEALKNVLTSPQRVILQNEDNTFKVVNANVTYTMFQQIKIEFSGISMQDIIAFLRSRMSLSEGEYNETYLLQDGFIPGDRVMVHNNIVELFDIMRHDKERNITFLYHVKEGFDYRTRIACSQIRVAANLLWMDRLKGETTYPDLFYKTATSAENSNTVYRKALQKKMDEETFRKMFSHNTKLVFVYAFMVPKDISSLDDVGPVRSSEFKDIAKSCGIKEDKIMVELQKKFLTEAGFLRDSFIDVTQSSFKKSKNLSRLNDMKPDDKKEIYDILAKHRCYISTIPKLELLELDREFSQYQIVRII